MLPVPDEFLEPFIQQLTEYILNQIDPDSDEISPYLKDQVVKDLKTKLDRNALSLNSTDPENIRATTEVIIKNLPYIISSIFSKLEKVISISWPKEDRYANFALDER